MKITPRTKDGKRITIDIKPITIPRGRKWTRTVTMTKTGEKFKVTGASCGLLRCFCDAIIHPK